MCLPAKLHLHNSHVVGYRSMSGVSSSHRCRASRARTHVRIHSLIRVPVNARTYVSTNARARIKFRSVVGRQNSFHRLEKFPIIWLHRAQLTTWLDLPTDLRERYLFADLHIVMRFNIENRLRIHTYFGRERVHRLECISFLIFFRH